ncbi:MAG: nucleotide exchange factor GrpE [Candidatus Margulisbacteria bacterium]|nr:nucleotide exchange factor GrpE [Candidatus Margulisiibacteriota bacterium]MBU1021442.1 nucleotide exchange factor GrpE [Candidatus Margulisiibacteriota bacterium]MBU1728363.1 nucleotide exchange factor GrpE [Candidatus Margulisiibacteriota bacterium]MBU1955894.1 nucleotide exchange factor GrpE [Candidatus Margulisiibacteriota bacterium]
MANRKEKKDINIEELKQKESQKGSPENNLDKTIKQEDQQIEDTTKLMLKALADLENYKKLAKKEKEEIAKFSNSNIITEFLPVVDGLERAIDAAKKHDTVEHIQSGIELVLKQFKDALNKQGAEEIDALGKKYDPNLHEAISTKESEGEEDIVLEQLHKGYKLNGRLIRPAVVIISKKKGE